MGLGFTWKGGVSYGGKSVGETVAKAFSSANNIAKKSPIDPRNLFNNSSGGTLNNPANLFRSVDARTRKAVHGVGEYATGIGKAGQDAASGFKTAWQNPKETLQYLWDQGMSHPLEGILGTGGGQMNRVTEGYKEGRDQKPNYSGMTDQDLYRVQSETSPNARNPFDNAGRDEFNGIYAAHSNPRVYATDNSFVFPDTLPVQQNTALIPATAQPMVAPGPAPLATAPQFMPEVTAQTAMPGYNGVMPNAETVVQQFAIPARTRKQSARQVL